MFFGLLLIMCTLPKSFLAWLFLLFTYLFRCVCGSKRVRAHARVFVCVCGGGGGGGGRVRRDWQLNELPLLCFVATGEQWKFITSQQRVKHCSLVNVSPPPPPHPAPFLSQTWIVCQVLYKFARQKYQTFLPIKTAPRLLRVKKQATGLLGSHHWTTPPRHLIKWHGILIYLRLAYSVTFAPGFSVHQQTARQTRKPWQRSRNNGHNETAYKSVQMDRSRHPLDSPGSSDILALSARCTPTLQIAEWLSYYRCIWCCIYISLLSLSVSCGSPYKLRSDSVITGAYDAVFIYHYYHWAWAVVVRTNCGVTQLLQVHMMLYLYITITVEREMYATPTNCWVTPLLQVDTMMMMMMIYIYIHSSLHPPLYISLSLRCGRT